MTKNRTITKLLGAIVLSATENNCIGRWVMVNKLELRNTQSFVNGVGPLRAAIDRLVNTTIVARVNDQVVSGLERKRMIVRVDGGADIRKFPRSGAGVANRFPKQKYHSG